MPKFPFGGASPPYLLALLQVSSSLLPTHTWCRQLGVRLGEVGVRSRGTVVWGDVQSEGLSSTLGSLAWSSSTIWETIM